MNWRTPWTEVLWQLINSKPNERFPSSSGTWIYFSFFKNPFLDPTKVQLIKLLISTCRCSFIWFSVYAKWFIPFRLTAYLTVNIYHVPHVCLMRSSTISLLCAHPTVVHLITLFSTRSFPFFSLCFQVLCM